MALACRPTTPSARGVRVSSPAGLHIPEDFTSCAAVSGPDTGCPPQYLVDSMLLDPSYTLQIAVDVCAAATLALGNASQIWFFSVSGTQGNRRCSFYSFGCAAWTEVTDGNGAYLDGGTLDVNAQPGTSVCQATSGPATLYRYVVPYQVHDPNGVLFVSSCPQPPIVGCPPAPPYPASPPPPA